MLAVLGMTLSGCGDGEAETGPPEETTSSQTPDGADPSETATGSATPPEGPDPATGRLIRQESAQLNAPKGWSVSEFGLDIWQARDTRTISVLTFSDFGQVPGSTPRSLARNSLRDLDRKPDVEFDVELDGAPAYAADAVRAGDPVIEYGAVLDDRAVVVSFSFDDDLPPPRRTAIAESVVASFAWR